MTHRILLCDDELHILRAAEFKFQRAGFDVVCASDGQEAWERIQEQVPDILVTDYQMPRMDGLELAKKIHETPETHNTPVVMLTAKGFELSRQEIREQYGILDLVSKPFSPRELLRKVQDVLSAETVTNGDGAD